jgi:Protein of unknown function (DUF3011)
MMLKKSQSWFWGREVKFILMALMAFILVGGSLFFVTAQNRNLAAVNEPLISETVDPQWRDRDRNNNRGRGREVQKFYCESGDGRRHWCHEGIGGQVRLIRERKGRCIEGRTWGQGRNGVWVDRGCRADFEVTRYRR